MATQVNGMSLACALEQAGIDQDDTPEFSSLDEISELSSEQGNPETLAMRHEHELGYPLVFDSEETNPTLLMHYGHVLAPHRVKHYTEGDSYNGV